MSKANKTRLKRQSQLLGDTGEGNPEENLSDELGNEVESLKGSSRSTDPPLSPLVVKIIEETKKVWILKEDGL